MDWKQLTEVVDKVKKLTTEIQRETDKTVKTSTEYNNLLRDELATPKECKEFSQLTECLAEIQDDLKNVKEKEGSKEINIEFVGATSSGKSSLINALLRERRLPVGLMQTTMCSIKVCTTEQKEWSVTVTDENGTTVLLSEANDEKAIKDLLSKMSGLKHSKEREELKINTRSIVQVNWPKELCEVLPSNVVLFDTPGFGEDKESMEVVTQSCREADIIVAVMNIMSPSKATVVKLVKDVNCQFTFGVFTKSDECKQKAAEEENEDAVDVEQARKDCVKDFRDALKDQCEVFFVDVKRVGNTDVGFKAFESKLASSATKLKGESLIKQAKAANVKSTETSEKFKNIVSTRRKKKIASLKQKLASIKEDCDAFKEMSENLSSGEEIKHIFSEDAKSKLLQEFEEAVMSGKSEKEALEKFIKKVNERIKDTMTSKRKDIETAFRKWVERLKHNYDFNMNIEVVSDKEDPQFRQFENQALPEDQYKWYCDPNNYYTNNYIMDGVFVLVTAATGFAGGAVLAGYMAAEALGFACGVGTAVGAVGGLAGDILGNFRFGDKLKKKIPISGYKVRCWRECLGCEMDKLHEDCKQRISQESCRIRDNYSKMLNKAKDCTTKEITALYDDSHNLNIWAEELDKSRKYLQKTVNDLDTLLAELREKIERAEEELRLQTDW